MIVAVLAPRGDGAERVTAVLSVPSEPDSVAVVAATDIDPATTYRLDGVWTARPVPPAPPSLVAETDATWLDLPVGAVVTIVSGLTGQTAGQLTATEGAVTLALDAGPWRLDVSEVFPAVAASYAVEVSS